MATTSSAAPAETEAEALIKRGNQLRGDGRDREALPLFHKAFEQQPTPRALAQIGLCEQALGLWVEAEAHLVQALANNDRWIKKNEAALRQALGVVRGKVGSLEIWGNPQGATVEIDGRAVGALPMERPTRVFEGQHAVVVQAPGHLTATRTLDVKPGALTREHVALVPIVALPRPSERPPAGARPDPPPPSMADPDQGGPGEIARPFYTRWWFWTIVGTVVVAAGASAYFVARRDNDCPASMEGTCSAWN